MSSNPFSRKAWFSFQGHCIEGGRRFWSSSVIPGFNSYAKSVQSSSSTLASQMLGRLASYGTRSRERRIRHEYCSLQHPPSFYRFTQHLHTPPHPTRPTSTNPFSHPSLSTPSRTNRYEMHPNRKIPILEPIASTCSPLLPAHTPSPSNPMTPYLRIPMVPLGA